MKIAIKDLIELEDRITYHGNDYRCISIESNILVAEYNNKYYIVDGHARIKKLKDEDITEVEADIMHVNSYEEIVKKHVERNYRSIIDYIALAMVCKEYNLDYVKKEILDNLDIEALRELDKAIRKYEYRAKAEIPRLLVEAISKVPIELQRDLVKVLIKNYRLVKEDFLTFAVSLGYLETIKEFLEYKKTLAVTEGNTVLVSKEEEEVKGSRGGEEGEVKSSVVSGGEENDKKSEEEIEGTIKGGEENEEEIKEEKGRMLKQGDAIEFNDIAEAFVFIRTDTDRLPEFAFYKLELYYERRDDLVVDKPNKVRLVVE